MDKGKDTLVFWAAVITGIAILVGVFSFKILGPDNKVEETCEDISELVPRVHDFPRFLSSIAQSLP